jgi:membrane-bound metal-dependent hydrolase YbcI (DUF457 family)
VFVGHGLLAFALVVLAARRAAWPRDRILAVGALAFAFGTLPDIDIVYAVFGLFGDLSGPFAAASAFWEASTVVHRTVTHSLVVGALAAVAFACWHGARTRTWATSRRLGSGAVAGTALVALVVVAFVASGPLAGAVISVFCLAGVGLTSVADRRLPWLTPRTVAAVALVGLLTHPFGDLLTGEPPAMLYPFAVTLVPERLVVHPDRTLHLLAAFGLELSAIWAAVAAYLSLSNRRIRAYVQPRAGLGLGYASAVLLVPAPTVDASYQFVFSILAVGVLGVIELRRGAFGRPLLGDGGSPSRADGGRFVGLADPMTTVVTALTAVTLAAGGYAIAYIFL